MFQKLLDAGVIKSATGKCTSSFLILASFVANYVLVKIVTNTVLLIYLSYCLENELNLNEIAFFEISVNVTRSNKVCH